MKLKWEKHEGNPEEGFWEWQAKVEGSSLITWLFIHFCGGDVWRPRYRTPCNTCDLADYEDWPIGDAYTREHKTAGEAKQAAKEWLENEIRILKSDGKTEEAT